MIKNILLVAAGGGLGAVLRYGVYLLSKPQAFPYSTLLINIAGSFLLGMIMALGLKNGNFKESAKLFLATGICGGFTTFSTFSFENIELLQQGKYNLAFIYIVASVLAGIAAAWFGFKLFH
jgi:fluoride exporter